MQSNSGKCSIRCTQMNKRHQPFISAFKEASYLAYIFRTSNYIDYSTHLLVIFDKKKNGTALVTAIKELPQFIAELRMSTANFTEV